MIRKLTLAGLASFGLLGVPLVANADQITLSNTASGITFTGTGTLVNTSITAGTGGVALFGSDVGTYTLGAVSFTAGPNVAEQYAAGANSESFSYVGADGDTLAGTMHWSFIQDNTNNPKFFGTMTVNSRSGDAAFVAAWALSAIGPIDFITTGIPGGGTLDQLVAGSHTATVGISAGEVVSTVPLPAALPLFASGLGALGLLGWRRKRKAAAVAAA
jgi:hypothetical protein